MKKIFTKKDAQRNIINKQRLEKERNIGAANEHKKSKRMIKRRSR